MVKNYKTMNIDEFKKTLEDTPWWVTNIFDDVDDVANAWELLYKGVVDDYVTERKAKVRTDSLPWFTTDLRKLLNKRFKLLKKWQKTKDPQTHIQYKKARNLAKKKLKAAETNYWKVEFEKATNSTQFWKVVRKVQRMTKTRQKHCFEIFRPKTEIGRTALRYRGPITWNALPTETKECENRTTFKIKLKRDKIINKVSYKKEAAIGTNKTDDFYYY